MKKLKRRISNPMTIIAIFATLSETSAAISLPFLDDNEREIYVWFLISFPFYLLFLFFLTLNFNYRSLYAPSDFGKDKHFVKVIDNAERLENKSPPPPDASTQESRFRCWFWSAQGPPAQINLPGRLKGLSIIDTRGMTTPEDLGKLMERIRKPRRHPTKVIVFLACGESEKLLKEGTFTYSKHKDKGAWGTFCVVYNLNTQGVTVLDQNSG